MPVALIGQRWQEVRNMVVVDLMAWLAWLLAGMLTGWLASQLLRVQRREGKLLDMLLGGLGALLAAWFVLPLVTPHAAARPETLDAVAVAALGAAALVLVVHGLGAVFIRRRRFR